MPETVTAVVAAAARTAIGKKKGGLAGTRAGGVAPAMPFSPMFTEKFEFVPQHQSAEMIADRWKLSRADCERFALESHQRAARAQAAGHFKDEIAPLRVAGGVFDSDE